jgi:hypothetical protein
VGNHLQCGLAPASMCRRRKHHLATSTSSGRIVHSTDATQSPGIGNPCWACCTGAHRGWLASFSDNRGNLGLVASAGDPQSLRSGLPLLSGASRVGRPGTIWRRRQAT